MKTLRLFYALALLCWCIYPTHIKAQLPSIDRCGSDEWLSQALANPDYAAWYAKLLDDRADIAASGIQKVTCTSGNTVYVPVAVHFAAGIGTTAAERTCLANLVNDQINILNAAYSDPSNETCTIFVLATQNHPTGTIQYPSGPALANGTPAITYNGAYTCPDGSPCNVNGSVPAGSGDWNGYLNLVVQTGTGVLGISPLGGTPNGTNSVVIEACAFGSTSSCTQAGPAAALCGAGWPYDGGITVVHEVGHWFSLDHTFCNDNGGSTENTTSCSGPGCSSGTTDCDGFSDTPPQCWSVYGNGACGETANACGGGPTDYNNFMDYGFDACLTAFSAQQTAAINTHANSVESQFDATTINVACANGIQDGTETGVDCGGDCAPCPVVGNSCGDSTDPCDGAVNAGADLTVCQGESVTLTATTGSKGTNYQCLTIDNVSTDAGTTVQACAAGSDPAIYSIPLTIPTFASATTVSGTAGTNGSISEICVTISGIFNEQGIIFELDHGAAGGTAGTYAWEDLYLGAAFTGSTEVPNPDGDGDATTLSLCFTPGQATPQFDGTFDGNDGTGAGTLPTWSNNSTSVEGPWELWIFDYGCYFTGGNADGLTVTANVQIQDGNAGTVCTFSKWTLNGGTTTLSTSSSYTLPTSITNTPGTYTYTATSDNCACSDQVVLTVDPKETAGAISISPTTVCNSSTFTVTQTTPAGSGAIGAFWALYGGTGPTAGFEGQGANFLTSDPNWLGVLGDAADNPFTPAALGLTAGGTYWVAPVSYASLSATGSYQLGDCYDIGTAVQITIIPAIEITDASSCGILAQLSGGQGGPYTYTVTGPGGFSQSGTTDTDGIIFYDQSQITAGGTYTVNVTDDGGGAPACTGSLTVDVTKNDDAVGTSSANQVVCYGNTFDFSVTGSVVATAGAAYSDIIGWGVSATPPTGIDDPAIFAFIPGADPAGTYTNNNGTLAGAVQPITYPASTSTPYTGTLAAGSCYYFTPFTMYNAPGTALAPVTVGQFVSGDDGDNPNNTSSTTYDYVGSFIVDGAATDGAGFNLTNICINIADHSWVGDLDMFLVSPEGSIIQLFIAEDSNNDGVGVNACFTASGTDLDTNGIFGNEGACAATGPCYAGNIAPIGLLDANGAVAVPNSLSLPAGEDPNGRWFIVVDDTYDDATPADGGGTLTSWSVTGTGGSFWTNDGNFPFPYYNGTCHLQGTPVQVCLQPQLATPVPTATTLANVCPATTADLTSVQPAATSTTGASFQWHTAATNPTTATQVPTPTAVGAGIYYLYETITNGSTTCYSAGAAVTVTITSCACANPPTANAGSDATQCAGTTFNLSGSYTNTTSGSWSIVTGTGTLGTPSGTTSPVTITYTPGAGETSATLRFTAADPDGAGTCVAATDDVVLTITPTPATPSIADATNICPATTVNLTTLSGATGVQWHTVASNPTTGTAVPTPTAVGAGTYYAYNVSGTCFSASDAVTVTINSCASCPANPTVSVSQANACGGGQVTVSTAFGTAGSGGATGTFTVTGDNGIGAVTLTGGQATVTLPANTGCTPITVTFTGTAQCSTGSSIPEGTGDLTATVTVYPTFNATNVTTTAGTCGVAGTISSTCPSYNFALSGGGSATVPQPGQSGNDTYSVTYAGAPTGCFSGQVQVPYSCACPTITGAGVSPLAICSGTALTLTGSSTAGTVTWVYSQNSGFNAYTQGTVLTGGNLPANTTCSPVTYYLKARLSGLANCQNVSEEFSVAVYPAVSVTASNGACAVSANVACPNFTTNWEITAGSNVGATGSGTTYTTTPTLTAQSGTVTFTVTQTGAPTGCATATAAANFSCPALVCAALDDNQSVNSTSACSGEPLSIVNGAVVNNNFPGGAITWVYSTTSGFNAYTAGTTLVNNTLPSNTGCSAVTYYIKARLDGVSSCQDTSNEFAVLVYPAIVAATSNGTCDTPAMVTGASIDCGYAVTWSDGTTNGSGNTYTPTAGTIGTVTFTVAQSGAPGDCQVETFVANYNCSTSICSELDNNQNVAETAICSGTMLTLTNGGVVDNDFDGGTVTWVYATTAATFNAYGAAAHVFTGDLPANTGCSSITYYVKARLDNVTGCTDQSSAFTVVVYPTLSISATSEGCSASALTSCNNFSITWQTATSNGVGNSFTAAAGEAGSITFTLTNTAAPAGCNTVTATTTYDCPAIVCSELDGTQAVAETVICSGGNLTLTNGSVIDNSYTGGTVGWVYGTNSAFNAYTSGTLFTGSLPANETCAPITYYLKARLNGVAGCQDASEAFAVDVYPTISATTFGSGCVISLDDNCGYAATWSANGQTGNGGVFTAAPGSTGTVTFTLTNPNAPSGCNSATVSATFNCPNIICSELDGNQSVAQTAICSGTALTLNSGAVVNNDYSGGFITWAYSTTSGFNAYTQGQTLSGNLPANTSCAPITYYLKARLDGLSNCQDVSQEFSVMVYPSINISATANSCTATLSNTCGYSATWSFNGQTGSGNTFTAAAGESGTVTFTVNIANAPSGCQTATATANVACPEVPTCVVNEAGVCTLTLVDSNGFGDVDVCDGFSAQAVATGAQVNDPNYEAGFIISNSQNLATATFIEFSSNGVFENDGTYPTGTPLYVYSAVTLAPFSAGNLSGECTDISAATMITFYAPITAMSNQTCQGSESILTVNLSGGAGGFTATGLDGTISGNTFTSSPITSGSSYTVSFSDVNGCTTAISGVGLNCEQPLPPVANIDVLNISIEEGGSVTMNVLTNDNDPNGDTISLIDATVDVEGATVEFLANGTITIVPPVGFNGVLTVNYTITDATGLTANGVATVTVVSELPCSQLSVSTNVEVVTVTNQGFTATITVSGGAPAHNGSMFTVTDNYGHMYTLANGETITTNLIETGSGMFDYIVSVVDACGENLYSEVVTVQTDVAIELLTFAGDVLPQGNLLKWVTISENNSSHFTLLRSNDGGNLFTEIATRPAAINSNITNYYEHLDKDAPSGLSYYRLDETDLSGVTTIAGYVTLMRGENNFQAIHVAPIPAAHSIKVEYTSANSGNVNINIFDASGKLVMKTSQVAQSGINTINLDVAALPTGVYMLSVGNDADVITTKMVKQ